jgi:hypothetical protein
MLWFAIVGFWSGYGVPWMAHLNLAVLVLEIIL